MSDIPPNADNPRHSGMEPSLPGQFPNIDDAPMIGGRRGETLRKQAVKGLLEPQALSVLLDPDRQTEEQRPLTPCVFLRKLDTHGIGMGNYSLDAAIAQQGDIFAEGTVLTLAYIGPQRPDRSGQKIGTGYMFNVAVTDGKLSMEPFPHTARENPAQLFVGIWAMKAVAARIHMPLEVIIPEARRADGAIQETYRVLREVLDGGRPQDLFEPHELLAHADTPKTYVFEGAQLVPYLATDLMHFRPIRQWREASHADII